MSEWPDTFETILRGHLPLAGDAAIQATDQLTDLGLDSIGTVSLLLELEEAFGVMVPDELLTAKMFATPASLWSTLADLSV